jgi:hypothetical protein
MLRFFATLLIISSLLMQLNSASGADDASPKLSVYPSAVSLNSIRDSQAMVVVVTLPDGATKDVSISAQYQVANPALAEVHDGIVEPKADGTTELTIRFEKLECRVPITIVHAKDEPVLTFRNDVLAVITRAGCNTGKCHGSASGKDGFRLSLFGYDPAGDHYRITRELAGRRINLASPEKSLLVNKALGNVPHTGGQRIEEGTRAYQTLIDWLAKGAVKDPDDTPRPVGIEVFPKETIFTKNGDNQVLLVQAHYSDGSDRDVTDLAVFFSNNEGAVSITEEGMSTAKSPGAAFITARFDEFSAGMSVIVRPAKPYAFPDIKANNYIDEAVHAHWKNLHLSPSGLASDEVFLRRVYIDTIGLLPTLEERERFLASKSENKRAELIDELLKRPEFLNIWVMKWAELLQIRTINGISPKGLQNYDQWLRGRIRQGATVADVLQELIPATGGTFENPATNYYQTETTPSLLAENVAQAFLGMRIQCAQCHNHPFDRWTMDDYYGFAAFFSSVGYKQAADPRELTVFNAGVGEMRHPVGDRLVKPKFLGGDAPQIAEGEDCRKQLSSWLTERTNKAFSRNIANQVWAHFLGTGIVEPIDDVRVSNPPSNPRLLDALADHLSENNFEIKSLVRDICNSRTYQLSTDRTPDNAWDERHFSHAKIRRMRAEVLLDCINQTTASQDTLPGLPPGSRAVHLADGRTQNYFLSTFGRATRNTVCSCEVVTSPTLSQALHLLNGETTSGKIAEGGVVARLLDEKKDPLLVVDALYIRCLSRLPTASERASIAERLGAQSDVSLALTDLFWALLNSNEFVFNH